MELSKLSKSFIEFLTNSFSSDFLYILRALSKKLDIKGLPPYAEKPAPVMNTTLSFFIYIVSPPYILRREPISIFHLLDINLKYIFSHAIQI